MNFGGAQPYHVNGPCGAHANLSLPTQIGLNGLAYHHCAAHSGLQTVRSVWPYIMFAASIPPEAATPLLASSLADPLVPAGCGGALSLSGVARRAGALFGAVNAVRVSRARAADVRGETGVKGGPGFAFLESARAAGPRAGRQPLALREHTAGEVAVVLVGGVL